MLRVAHRGLRVAWCMLRTVGCMLHGACCVLRTVGCELHGACRALCVACCMVHGACCVPWVAHASAGRAAGGPVGAEADEKSSGLPAPSGAAKGLGRRGSVMGPMALRAVSLAWFVRAFSSSSCTRTNERPLRRVAPMRPTQAAALPTDWRWRVATARPSRHIRMSPWAHAASEVAIRPDGRT